MLLFLVKIVETKTV